MKAVVSNTITVSEPSKKLLDWCKAHLVLPNPEYATRLRMNLYTGKTPKEISLYEKRGQSLVLPFGTLRDIMHILNEGEIVTDFAEPVKVDYRSQVSLYDYQAQAVQVCLAKKYGILKSPAGSGKTQMGIALIERLGERALWLTHTHDLLLQSKERAEQYIDASLMGTITEGKVEIGEGITFATIQTMCKLDLSQYKNLWDVIICDECFPRNTAIETSNGTKFIQDIRPGEYVLTCNHINGNLEYCEVEELQDRPLRGCIVEFHLTNGECLRCTANHPIFTRDGYKKAGELTVDDEVRVLRKRIRQQDTEKNAVLDWTRVESITVHEQRSARQSNGVCSEGRVYNLSVKRNHNYFANGVLVHNCHRISGSPTTVTQYYKVLNVLSARHKYGLSATVHRGDGMIEATHALIGRVICSVPESAVADKIMTVGIRTISTGTPLSRECLNSDGILNYTNLINYLCRDDSRNEVIRDSIVAERDKSCLILSDRVGHLETLMSVLPDDIQENAVIINGSMVSKKAKAERDNAIAEMRNGSKKYLFATYGLAKEGLDIPRLERVFFTTPHKDYAVVTQSIGRIARTFEGKADPVALDFVDDIPYCRKAYKERCRTYRKNGCVFE